MYSWFPQNLDTALLEQKGDPVVRSTSGGTVGGGGLETYRFETVGAGTTILTLGYQRPWEEDVDPVDFYTVTLTIK